MREATDLDRSRIVEILAGLRPGEPPRLGFVRRAPQGIDAGTGTLLCLSASFNPMTMAHAALIREGSRRFPAQELLLLLATANVDKSDEGLSLERRFDLLVRFAASRPNVSVAAVVHGRFVDKMAAIRRVYSADIRLIFLLGFDTLVRLFDPKYYVDRAVSLAHLFDGSECAVANRGADAVGAVERFLTRPDVSPFANRIHVVQLPGDLADVSATTVRARLARGDSITDLVPPEILAPLEACRRAFRDTGSGSR